MTSVLLDTNALLWLLSEPGRLNSAALSVISDPATEVCV